MSVMKDFTEFEAFHRCRDFARAVSKPILAGTFSRDPVLVYQMRKSLLSQIQSTRFCRMIPSAKPRTPNAKR